MHLLHRQRSKGARISHHHHHLYQKKTDPRSIIKVYIYDSDDEIDYEDVDEFGMHEMTDKEYKEYSRQIKDSEGFDVMDFPESFSCGKIIPIIDLNDRANHLKTLSELALKEYYEKEKTKLEFVKFVKANGELCEGLQYYITFDVKDADAVDGPILTFQALVWDGIYRIEVLLCRLKISN
ncbi:uncharacterized protein LOC114281078 [Camellia sinensis]|uniref:uncharacterized protein LOC114281078 n=1 Tax=Camellia sinensis TaxID=4442 RepID=UPI001036D055|nr:uncharacterized protein LOC114281078 [Camellia sinensis]